MGRPLGRPRRERPFRAVLQMALRERPHFDRHRRESGCMLELISLSN
jgi:hypothetical protein